MLRVALSTPRNLKMSDDNEDDEPLCAHDDRELL